MKEIFRCNHCGPSKIFSNTGKVNNKVIGGFVLQHDSSAFSANPGAVDSCASQSMKSRAQQKLYDKTMSQSY